VGRREGVVCSWKKGKASATAGGFGAHQEKKSRNRWEGSQKKTKKKRRAAVLPTGLLLAWALKRLRRGTPPRQSGLPHDYSVFSFFVGGIPPLRRKKQLEKKKKSLATYATVLFIPGVEKKFCFAEKNAVAKVVIAEQPNRALDLPETLVKLERVRVLRHGRTRGAQFFSRVSSPQYSRGDYPGSE